MKKSLAQALPFFLSLAAAIWPVPVSYQHGDKVLWVSKDVNFSVHGTGAKRVGIHAHQARLGLTSHSTIGPGSQDTHRLPERDSSSANQDASNRTAKGVTGREIVDFAINSTVKTILQHNFYPWKFHPRDWKEPSSKEKVVLVSQVDLTLLSSDPVTVGKPLAGDIDESYSLSLAEDGKASIRPYLDYCSPFHNWHMMYSYNPLAGIPPHHQHLVLGGEAHMWTEQTGAANVDHG